MEDLFAADSFDIIEEKVERSPIIDQFLTMSRFNVDKFFPGWQRSGKTYMIPPAPVTKFVGPVDEGASGYDEKIVKKKQSIIRGDSAEAVVHK